MRVNRFRSVERKKKKNCEKLVACKSELEFFWRRRRQRRSSLILRLATTRIGWLRARTFRSPITLLCGKLPRAAYHGPQLTRIFPFYYSLHGESEAYKKNNKIGSTIEVQQIVRLNLAAHRCFRDS